MTERVSPTPTAAGAGQAGAFWEEQCARLAWGVGNGDGDFPRLLKASRRKPPLEADPPPIDASGSLIGDISLFAPDSFFMPDPRYWAKRGRKAVANKCGPTWHHSVLSRSKEEAGDYATPGCRMAAILVGD